MVGLAIFYPEVSESHREGDLKEEQSQRGREYLEESVSGRGTAGAKAPRWGHAWGVVERGGHCGWRSRPGRQWEAEVRAVRTQTSPDWSGAALSSAQDPSPAL